MANIGVVFSFKPLIPEEYLTEAMKDYVGAFMEEEAALLARAFHRTTSTWGHQPEFVQEVVQHANLMQLRVLTTDPVYVMLNNGPDKASWAIRPKKPGGKLRFSSGYIAKTTPRVIGAHAGGPSGDTVFSRGVTHHGYAARQWSEEIWDRREQGAFYKKLQEAIDRGLRGRKRRNK